MLRPGIGTPMSMSACPREDVRDRSESYTTSSTDPLRIALPHSLIIWARAPGSEAACASVLRVERLLERLEQEVGVLRLERERRADLEHVAVASGGADQDAAAAHSVHHAFCLRRPDEPAHRVGAQLDAQEESRAPHRADRGIALGERA